MKAMEKANEALMEKMREALHKPTEVDKLLAHPGREEERLIAQYMQKAPAVHHAPLPKGWKKMYDGKGTEYWDNLLTHRTSWTRPAAPAPPLAALSQAAPAPPLAAPKPLVVSKAAQKAADKTADKTPPAGPTAAAKGAAAGRLQAAHARGRGAARR
ncbi:hypothetical protein T484DRAFT_3447060 [Baffinella frigidus]|nr:hypothetical protein T484DRAFT_3447060 [Cryptophyta sp. CCMP2293]